MKKFFFLYLIISIVSVSCIPNKDLVYLQKGNEKKQSIEINPSNTKPYRVQTNDVLSITIKALDQKLVDIFTPSTTGNQNQNSAQSLYFNGFTVDDHGNIRIPVLGELNVLGYTTEEIRTTIEKRLLDEYFNTQARLFVNVKMAGLSYTINGEIGSTGTQVIFKDRANIMEAIANSGDITFTGDRKNVQVIRKVPHGFETYYLDLTDADAVNSPAFYLQPNDYIYIKPLRQKSWGTGTTVMQSVGTIMTALSLITTTILLTRNL